LPGTVTKKVGQLRGAGHFAVTFSPIPANHLFSLQQGYKKRVEIIYTELVLKKHV